MVTLQKSQKLSSGQFLLQWPLLPHQEHIIVFFDESEGWVAGLVYVNAFFDLVAPGPLLFVGALVDPLVSLHSGGSWWLVLGFVTGEACDGPPACVCGCCRG